MGGGFGGTSPSWKIGGTSPALENWGDMSPPPLKKLRAQEKRAGTF